MFFFDLDKCLQLPCSVYLKDPKGIVRECNDFQAKYLGLSKPDEVIGLNGYDFLPSKDAKIIQENDLSVIHTQQSKIMIEQVTVNDTVIQLLSFKIPLFNDKKKIIGIYGTSIKSNESNGFFEKFFTQPIIPSYNADTLSGKKLSKREKECLNFLIQGMTAKEIAKKLKLSHRTVEYYIEKMKVKFNCSTKMELIIKAIPIFT